MNIRKSMMALAFAASCALAALPSTMLFQGHMPGVNGVKPVTVLLYDDAEAGTLVWNETNYLVEFKDGYFALQLGSSGAGLPAFDKPLFVSLSVDGTASATRIPLTLAPYAKRAAVADSSVKADYATSAGSAKTAEKADEATNAMNATHATTATTANSAINAINATNASSAVKASFATSAGSLEGASTVSLLPAANGYAIVSAESTNGYNTDVASLLLIPSKQTVELSVSSGGGGTGSGAGLTVGRSGLDFGGTGIRFPEYMPVISGSTACTADMWRMVVFTNSGKATRGLYVCDDNGSGSYYWYKL